MEVITGLVLILLGAAGARNIPVHKNAPSETPLEFDNLRSNTENPLATIFPTGELVESGVNDEGQRLHLNKNAEEDKIVKDHVYNVVSLETDDNQEEENQKEIMESVLGPVEVIELHNYEKTEKRFLEDRVAFDGGCPKGTFRVGNNCEKEDTDLIKIVL